MAIRFSTFNCNGFKSTAPGISELISTCDVICLQELMITKQECSILNNNHPEFYGHAVYPGDASLGIISGRPYGGVGCMWRKSIDSSITILPLDYDWICGMNICDASREF